MFSADERIAVRDALVARARSDASVVAAAVIGSAARGAEDAWSDIDLALSCPMADPDVVCAAWTRAMYAEHDVVHHVDLWSRGVRFRVFLLATTLQVDVSFWPGEEFLVAGHRFDPVVGVVDPAASMPASAPSTAEPAGMGWLYALHVRSAIARGRRWQAVYMLDGMRDQIVAMACLRAGLPLHEGRGVDRLPEPFLAALTATRARDVELDELRRAFSATIALFLEHVAVDDPELAATLRDPVLAVAGDVRQAATARSGCPPDR